MHHALYAGVPPLLGTRNDAFFDSNPAFAETPAHLKMISYIFDSIKRTACYTLPQFGPNAPRLDRKVSSVLLRAPIFHDPKYGQQGKHFLDFAATKYLMKIDSSVTHHVRSVAQTRSKSLFQPDRLTASLDDLEADTRPPTYDVPEILDQSPMFHYAAYRTLNRWSAITELDITPLEAAMYKGSSWAGISYTGKRVANYTLATRRARNAEMMFLEDGVRIEKYTPYALICRIQSSPRERVKHRPVCAESAHNLLVMSQPATSVYKAMLHRTQPSTFGTTLGDQSAVDTHLEAQAREWFCQVSMDFSSFDWGKRREDGTYTNGVQGWEIRFAFLVIFRMFNGTPDNFVSLLFSLNYSTFKRVASQLKLYTFSELLASGVIWIFVLDSIICDLRNEFVSCSLGDPYSARIVGGDDSLMLLSVPCNFDTVNLALAPWGVSISEEKSRVALQLGLLRFHGHYHEFGEPARPDLEAVDCAILLERGDIDEDDLELSAGRLKAIWLDSGRRWPFLEHAFTLMERDLGFTVPARALWHEDTWMAPTVLGSISL